MLASDIYIMLCRTSLERNKFETNYDTVHHSYYKLGEKVGIKYETKK